MLGEVSKRRAREGRTLFSFLSNEKGLKRKEMRRTRVQRRSSEIVIALERASLFRIHTYWRMAATPTNAKRR
jgi:hypothetical protein